MYNVLSLKRCTNHEQSWFTSSFAHWHPQLVLFKQLELQFHLVRDTADFISLLLIIHLSVKMCHQSSHYHMVEPSHTFLTFVPCPPFVRVFYAKLFKRTAWCVHYILIWPAVCNRMYSKSSLFFHHIVLWSLLYSVQPRVTVVFRTINQHFLNYFNSLSTLPSYFWHHSGCYLSFVTSATMSLHLVRIFVVGGVLSSSVPWSMNVSRKTAISNTLWSVPSYILLTTVLVNISSHLLDSLFENN